MNRTTRRGFLALTGTGVAAAAAVAPTSLAAVSDTGLTGNAPAARTGNEPSAPMVAYVRDAAAGQVAVMVGEREVVVHDRALVAQLARHLRA